MHNLTGHHVKCIHIHFQLHCVLHWNMLGTNFLFANCLLILGSRKECQVSMSLLLLSIFNLFVVLSYMGFVL